MPKQPDKGISQPTLSDTADAALADARCQGLAGALPLDPNHHPEAASEQPQPPDPSSKRLPLTQRMTLRLPPDTAAAWRQHAAADDQSLSDWIRQRVDGAAAVQTGLRRQRRRLRTLTADPELLRQLAAIGSNVNQIARVLNSAGLSPGDHIGLLAELAAIQRELRRLAELPWYAKDDEGTEEPACTSNF